MSADPEAAYYQGIEEFFVSLRGDPLFLSNADWLLVRKWRREEIPLRIVLRGIRDALDSHAHSLGRHRRVGSLAYCASEVEAARDRWRRALDLGAEPGLDVGRGLAQLVDLLGRAVGLGPRAAAAAARIRAELGEAAGATLSEVELRLSAAEAALLAEIRHEDGEAVFAAVEREVEALVAPYRGRMPERVLGQIREDSRARRLLEHHGLPRLSLFHLEDLHGDAQPTPVGRP
ncbi:MAG TPA: hypothetical protein VLL75_09720 [Vicinamibacteria bacterium]|nr:hypothetical protein [Vicinamibacteria bacterium]